MGSRESLEGGEHNGEIGFSNGDESWLIWWREKQGMRGIRLSWEPLQLTLTGEENGEKTWKVGLI